MKLFENMKGYSKGQWLMIAGAVFLALVLLSVVSKL